MHPSILLRLVPLFALLLSAAIIDARQRRIPNWLTGAMALAGLIQSFTAVHTCSPLSSMLGLLAGFALMIGQFALGGLGGGDVKLIAGVGTWVGPLPLLAIFVVTSLVGMVIVLVQATWQGRLQALVRNSALLAINLAHLHEVGVEHATATGRSCRSIDRPLPYAVPVLLATLLVAGRQWLVGA